MIQIHYKYFLTILALICFSAFSIVETLAQTCGSGQHLVSYSFIDRDQDGYFTPFKGRFCSRDKTLPQKIGNITYSGNNPRKIIDECDNNKDGIYNVPYAFIDRDGDGYFARSFGKICSNRKAFPQQIEGISYSVVNSRPIIDQCDEDKESIYRVPYSYIDRDGDGIFTKETGSICSDLKTFPQTGIESNRLVTYAILPSKLLESKLQDGQAALTSNLGSNNSSNNPNSGPLSKTCGCGYGTPVFNKDDKVVQWKGKIITVKKTAYTPTWGGNEGGPKDAFGNPLIPLDVSNLKDKGETTGAAGNSKTRGPFGNLKPVKMRDNSIKPGVKLIFNDGIGTIKVTDVGSANHFPNGPSSDGSYHVDICVNPGSYQDTGASKPTDNRYHPSVNGKSSALLCQLKKENYEKYCICDKQTSYEENESCYCSHHPDDKRCLAPCVIDEENPSNTTCDDDPGSNSCPWDMILDEGGNCVDPNQKDDAKDQSDESKPESP